MPSDLDSVVLYHGPDCQDGFASAFAAWTILGDRAKYQPVQYGQPVPLTDDGADVYVVDFSFSREQLIALARRSNRVIVLDHHKTARDALAGLDGTVPGLSVTFDMEKSGAVLAWEHFHPGEPVPALLRYVQDRDLWRWALPHSREVSAALAVEPRDFGRWAEVMREFSGGGSPPMSLLLRGEAILAYQARLFASLCDRAAQRDIAGYDVPSVNSPILQSEIGEELLRRNPDTKFVGVFFTADDDAVIWSLRSRPDFDVSEVAVWYGGGGHRQAAGFRVPPG